MKSFVALVISVGLASPALAQRASLEQTHSPAEPPALSVGGFVGHFWQQDQRDGDDLGLVARADLRSAVFLDAEVGRLELDAGGRANRIGGSAGFKVREGRVTPYLALGAGALYSVGSERSLYGEAGGGVELRIWRRLSLVGDARWMVLDGGSSQATGKAKAWKLRDQGAARWRAMMLVSF